MGRQVAPRQQTAVDGGVQRLHAPVQDFGEAGDVGNAFDRKSRPGQRLLGAAGGEYLKAQPSQAVGKVNRPGFIGYAYNRSYGFPPCANFMFGWPAS
jgi:hypothetical protein